MRSCHRVSGVFLLTALLGACGLIDDAPARLERQQVSPGTIRVTDDWSCVADQHGEWECAELDPEPAYVPTPPPVPSDNGDTDSFASETEPQGEPERDPVTDAISDSAGGTPSGSNGIASRSAVNPGGENGRQDISSEGYVLQIAAHHTMENARRALATLEAPGAQIVKTRGERGDFYVIIAGSYDTLADAKAAADQFQSRNNGLDYWIRDAEGFLEAR